MTTLPPTNHAGQAVELTGDSTIDGGNWCGAEVVRHGHALTIAPGGNYRGLRVDGAPLRPEALPAGVTVAPGVYLWPDWLPEPPRAPLPLALAILATINHFLGEDGRAAWLHAVEVVLTTAPAPLTLDDLEAAHAEWAAAPWNNNLIDWPRCVATLWAAHFPGLTWAELVALVRRHDLATWAGAPTEST